MEAIEHLDLGAPLIVAKVEGRIVRHDLCVATEQDLFLIRMGLSGTLVT